MKSARLIALNQIKTALKIRWFRIDTAMKKYFLMI